jgi:hypothetical protein
VKKMRDEYLNCRNGQRRADYENEVDVLWQNLAAYSVAFLSSADARKCHHSPQEMTFLQAQGKLHLHVLGLLETLAAVAPGEIAALGAAGVREEDNDASTCPDDKVTAYDPSDGEPRTFKELVDWMAYWMAFRKPKQNGLSPPKSAASPDHHYLECLCIETFGAFDLDALSRLRSKFLVQTAKTIGQIDETTLRELAEHFRRQHVQEQPVQVPIVKMQAKAVKSVTFERLRTLQCAVTEYMNCADVSKRKTLLDALEQAAESAAFAAKELTGETLRQERANTIRFFQVCAGHQASAAASLLQDDMKWLERLIREAGRREDAQTGAAGAEQGEGGKLVVNGAKEPKADPGTSIDDLPGRAGLAMHQYRMAAGKVAEEEGVSEAEVTDERAWQYLRDQGMRLPCLESWTRNLRLARSPLGLQKKKPRKKYTGGSAAGREHFNDD